VTGKRGLALVVGYAGTGKSAMLGVAREAWERAAYAVRGVALSGIAAENLEAGSGIASRTIASLEHAWSKGNDLLASRDVLVVDEAGMVGTRQLERVLSCAADAGAKVVLVGDPQQLQAIEAGAAFRALYERHGGVEITEIRRQHVGWQRDATRHLATGRTGEAIRAYDEHGLVHLANTRDVAREALIDRWDGARQADPSASRIILTHTNDEVRELNLLARDRMRMAGDLGKDATIETARGERQFASGDRIMFLRNERGLGIKNGTLGTVEAAHPARLAIRNDDGRKVAFDTKDYAHVDHGYAATIHKAQGVTVDRSHVLATPGMDSHASYVAFSRHRDGMDLHYGKDDFADQSKLVRLLGRERVKDMASDHADADPAKAFAERRGITFRERIAELVRMVPEKVRGIFDGFRPKASGLEKPPPPHRTVSVDRRAVERFARAYQDVAHAADRGLPVLPHQSLALERAGQSLDAIRPLASTDLASAFARRSELASEAAEGRGQAAVSAMHHEAKIQIDPAKRAERFVSDWKQLGAAREQLRVDGDHAGAGKLAARMAELAKGIGRDPQLETHLRPKARELGIDLQGERSLERELTKTLSLERSRNFGMSL
ncbi:MAG: AAA family ATPase, partial [Novosphingobium sp.]